MFVRKVFIASIEDERRPAVEKTSWMERMKSQNISLCREKKQEISKDMANKLHKIIVENFERNCGEKTRIFPKNMGKMARQFRRKYGQWGKLAKKIKEEIWQENMAMMTSWMDRMKGKIFFCNKI